MLSSGSVSRGIPLPLVGLAFVSACGFQGVQPQGEVVVDSSIDVAIADASGCQSISSQCVGEDSKLRVCSVIGEFPTDYDCDWGCNATAPAHCAKLVPAGGYLLPTDLDPSTGPQDVNLGTGDYEFNAVTGEIKPGIRAAGPDVISGIHFERRNGKIGIFKFAKLTLGAGRIKVVGQNPIALVSLSTITMGADIDLQGDCMSRNAGPGGSDGGTALGDGYGMGGGGFGLGTDSNCYGGGGGGFGGRGGAGSIVVDNRGDRYGTDPLTALLGGSGGGGGGGGQGGDGGGGGGAIQMIAQRRITITGGINVGGCGGKTGGGCGGGGGAGGAILLEAPVIDFIGSKLAANGGGGGGAGNGTAGERASLSNQAANGGAGGNGSSGRGGTGGDDGSANGFTGEPKNRAGGGGGAVGRMRFNTLSGTIVTSGTVLFSPAVSTAQAVTTVTKGKAAVQ